MKPSLSIEMLPPTDPAAFVPPAELLAFIKAFNRGDYRAAVDPVEALFFQRRNTFHQGLLQYDVALMQLALGIVRGPRRLLRRADELLAPYEPWQEGLDLDAIRAHIAAWRQALPEDVAEMDPVALAALGPPPPRLEIAPPKEPR